VPPLHSLPSQLYSNWTASVFTHCFKAKILNTKISDFSSEESLADAITARTVRTVIKLQP
jgi:hypothetical protein